MDGGDLVLDEHPLIRREVSGSRRHHPAVFALISGSSWIVVWTLTR